MSLDCSNKRLVGRYTNKLGGYRVHTCWKRLGKLQCCPLHATTRGEHLWAVFRGLTKESCLGAGGLDRSAAALDCGAKALSRGCCRGGCVDRATTSQVWEEKVAGKAPRGRGDCQQGVGGIKPLVH